MSCSGTPLDYCAKTMIEHGTNLPPEQIAKAMVDYVAKKEFERVPWTNGVLDVLGSLVDAGIPSVLVTTSPRRLAQNVIDHAPADAFAGFVCGDDDLPHKPDPVHIWRRRRCSASKRAWPEPMAPRHSWHREVRRFGGLGTGIASAVASGATTIAQLGFNRNAKADGPQCASIDGFAGITAEALNASSAIASAPEPPAVAESSSRWRGCRLKADWGWSLLWGVFTVSALEPPPVSLCSTVPRQRGRMVIGAKNEKGRSRWNGIGFVELMVIETTTSSMRTKRSTN